MQPRLRRKWIRKVLPSLESLEERSLLAVSALGGANCIDFETLPDGSPSVDNSELSRFDTYRINQVGATFGFDTDGDGIADENPIMEEIGTNDPDGFISSLGADAPAPEFAAQLGNFFIRPVGNFGDRGVPVLIINYDSPINVHQASGEIWDIDRGGDGVEQWEVRAYDASNNLLDTIASPAGVFPNEPTTLDGRPWTFEFTGLSDINRIEVEFTTERTNIGLAFNNFCPFSTPGGPGSIYGTKWEDENGNGVLDVGESGLPGWTIYLDLNNNGTLDEGEPSTVTAADDPMTPEDETGTYELTNVQPGTYTVAEVLQTNWNQTFPVGLDFVGIDFDGQLYDVDRATGQATNLRDTGIGRGPAGVTSNDQGLLYTVTTAVANESNSLLTIDPVNGRSNLIGSLGQTFIEGDLDIDPTTGILYAFDNAASNQLIAVDTTTGAATDVRSIPGITNDLDPSAVAFDSSGTLYVLDTRNASMDGPARLLTVDIDTRTVTSTVTLSSPLGGTAGMDFDPMTGDLYIVDGFGAESTNSLWLVDLVSGDLSLVGPLGNADGLAGLEIVSMRAGTHVVDVRQGQLITGIDFGNQSAAQPDLVPISMSLSPYHVLLGQTTATFTIENRGSGNASSFDVDLIWSDEDVIGNSDDVIQTTVNIPTGLSAGQTVTMSVDLQLDQGTLFDRTRRDDPNNLGTGYVSREVDTISINVDPVNAIAEELEDNNSGQGLGIDLVEFTYFPWDVDDDGANSPTDAIFVINRIGQSPPPCQLAVNPNCDALADLDGNGIVTPTDAISIINRLGYTIRPEAALRPFTRARSASSQRDADRFVRKSEKLEPVIDQVFDDIGRVRRLESRL